MTDVTQTITGQFSMAANTEQGKRHPVLCVSMKQLQPEAPLAELHRPFQVCLALHPGKESRQDLMAQAGA